jgi:hypothetical protein
VTPWTTDIALRVRRHWLLKAVGTTAWIWAFFIGYFHILRHPAHAAVTMPLTALDRLIPLQPAWLVPYFSLWIYVGIAPGLQRSFIELLVYGLWSGALCITGLAIFYVWPSAVAPLPPDASTFPGFALLQGIDASGNACPSMHVAIAIFSAICLEDLLRQVRAPAVLRGANIAWFLAIAYSTLAVKQHVAWDVAAGALLGTAFALPSLRWKPRGRFRAVPSIGADIIGSH